MQLFRRNRDTAGSAAARRAISASNQLGRLAEKGADQASATLANVREQSREAVETAGESLSDLRSTIETSIREQPITALLIAAIAGAAFGAFLRPGK
ncbi:MAG: hypothetical protein ACR650_15100 [Methylocystis sp.]|jgi:hypothetical protein